MVLRARVRGLFGTATIFFLIKVALDPRGLEVTSLGAELPGNLRTIALDDFEITEEDGANESGA